MTRSQAIESEYSVKQAGDAVIFEVTPATAPKFGFATVLGVVFLLIGLGQLFSDAVWGFAFLFLPMGGLCLWGARRDSRPPVHRTPAMFRIVSNSIESNGKTFRRADIHRLSIKNPMSDEETGTTVVVARPSLAGDSAAAARRHRGKVAAVCYGLDVEAGGKAHTLAGGMNSTTAYGLLHDVSKRLGFDVA